MAINAKDLVPAMPLHPGTILMNELEERQIKHKDFAARLGISATNLSAILHGRRNVSERMAIKLEEELGISFQTWMNLQNGYVYDLIRCRERDRRKAKEVVPAKTNASVFVSHTDKNLSLSFLPA